MQTLLIGISLCIWWLCIISELLFFCDLLQLTLISRNIFLFSSFSYFFLFLLQFLFFFLFFFSFFFPFPFPFICNEWFVSVIVRTVSYAFRTCFIWDSALWKFMKHYILKLNMTFSHTGSLTHYFLGNNLNNSSFWDLSVEILFEDNMTLFWYRHIFLLTQHTMSTHLFPDLLCTFCLLVIPLHDSILLSNIYIQEMHRFYFRDF